MRWRTCSPLQRSATLAALAAVLSLRTVARNTDWRDDLSLFSSAVRVVPGSARAHCNLGAEYLARGESHSVFQELQTALQIYPDYPDALADFGVLQQRLGDNGEARRLLEKAVSLASQGTLDRGVLSVTLASHLMGVNEDAAALGILTQVIADWPGYAHAWSTRAVLHWKQRDFEAARSDAQSALLLDPTDAQAQRLLSDLSANPR